MPKIKKSHPSNFSGGGVSDMASGVVETFINKTTLSLGAVVVFGLTLFGIELGSHDLELGLGLLAASRVVE